MRRRDFLAMAGAAPLVGWRRANAQNPPIKRAAVAIGVNKAGDLPRLNDAVAGAHNVTKWLRLEGFHVEELVDESVPVAAAQVTAAIDRLLKPGTLEQLLVYFSGHGFLVGFGEYWLLSGAPRSPNESINAAASAELARYCGVPNVVFISDACRSTSTSLGIHQILGQGLFPTSSPGALVSSGKVDRFFATQPGQSAFEISVQQSTRTFKGIFTDTFLEAYRNPDRSMVVDLDANTRVVPNRKLENYLIREVRKRAEAKSIRLTQTPESRVESDAYIGRVLQGRGRPLSAATPRPPTVADVAAAALDDLVAMMQSQPSFTSVELAAVAASSGYQATESGVRGAVAGGVNVPTQFETQTGFVVFGARIASVAAIRRDLNPQLLSPADPAVVRTQTRPGNVLLRFADGTGAVVACIPGFIGTVFVDDSGIVDVSYLPSRNTSRWQADSKAVLRLNDIRGSVAAAMQQGVFRFEGDTENRRAEAKRLVEVIRVSNGLDPTLGLYAAYAFSDAGLADETAVVLDIMRADLKLDLFDVALLRGALRGRSIEIDDPLVLPFFPMLTHGWNLLGVRGVELAKGMDDLRNSLRPSTWTTFTKEGMNILNGRFGP